VSGAPVTVRRAEVTDAEAAVEVVRRSITELCTADHHDHAETLAKWLSNKTVPNFVSWFSDHDDNFCVIAEANGRLSGVGLLHRDGEVRLFYLVPGAQRRGTGKAIHAALEEQARAWGIPELKLESTALARAFYERLGYRSTGPAMPRFGVLRCYPYVKSLPDYGGMTVNERLVEAGLMSDFEAAVRAQDRSRIMSVLMRVALSKEDAAFTADVILGNPKRYGF
jgi:GNAT superfamily N-acetyltransferase